MSPTAPRNRVHHWVHQAPNAQKYVLNYVPGEFLGSSIYNNMLPGTPNTICISTLDHSLNHPKSHNVLPDVEAQTNRYIMVKTWNKT